MATAPLGGREDVDRAVAAAQAAFEDRKGWANWAAGKRGRTLAKFAALLKEHSEELAQLESQNVGKPISGARGEVIGASLVFDYYAGAANKIFGQTIPVTKPGLDLTLREPIGVVGLIVPWNFPILMASWKVAPALAAGNTAILKPASYTPLTAIRLGELALEAGIPAGVLNIVTGPGGTAGASIAAHPGIGKVAFTGETTTGQEIMRLASGNVKKVSLELGGKSPNIVFADADLEKFARESPYSVFDNTGQDCCARSRILVERSAHDQVVELFAAATRAIKVGDPADEATEVGTLVSFKQRDRVQEYIEIGLGEGATLVVGGDVPTDPALADGAYLMPTVFDGATNDMRIAREEIFGPVVSIIPFDTEEEALRLANATPYGLSGSIWSRDIGKALRAARGAPAGRDQRQLELVRPHRGAVRRLQDVRHRARARDVRARPLHRDEERLHRPDVGDGRPPRSGPGRPCGTRSARRPGVPRSRPGARPWRRHGRTRTRPRGRSRARRVHGVAPTAASPPSRCPRPRRPSMRPRPTPSPVELAQEDADVRVDDAVRAGEGRIDQRSSVVAAFEESVDQDRPKRREVRSSRSGRTAHDAGAGQVRRIAGRSMTITGNASATWRPVRSAAASTSASVSRRREQVHREPDICVDRVDRREHLGGGSDAASARQAVRDDRRRVDADAGDRPSGHDTTADRGREASDRTRG